MAARQSRMLPLGTPAPDFSLPDTEGKIWTLGDFTAPKGLLVAFICNHCPYVKHILDGFVEFAHEYGAKGLDIVAINANDATAYPDDSPQYMAKVAKAKGFSFPYLYDETQRTALAYEAICTPDFFLFDSTHNLVYRGRFDASTPGNIKPVTGIELRTAVDALFSGRRVEHQNASIGCSIKWKSGNAPDWA